MFVNDGIAHGCRLITSKFWQMQLEWETERRAYQTGRLVKIKDKMNRGRSEFELSCSAAGMSPATYYHQHVTSWDEQAFQADYKKLFTDRESCETTIPDPENNIADLEQKLRSASSS